MVFECGVCVQERLDGAEAPPEGYFKTHTGATPLGMQVWCDRHDINIMHIDFEGQTHPANMTAPRGDIHNATT